MQRMAFCVWHISPNGMVFRSVYVVACVRAPVLFMPKYYSIVWMGCIVFMHSSIDGQLGFSTFR